MTSPVSGSLIADGFEGPADFVSSLLLAKCTVLFEFIGSSIGFFEFIGSATGLIGFEFLTTTAGWKTGFYKTVSVSNLHLSFPENC